MREVKREEGRVVKFKCKVSKIIFPKTPLQAGNSAIVSVVPLENEDKNIFVTSWGNTTIKGKVPMLTDDTVYTVEAEEIKDKKYGWQYKILVMTYEQKGLKDDDSGREFLKTILTEKQYMNLINGTDTPIALLESQDYDALTKIKGLGLKSAKKLVAKYESLKGSSGDILLLAKYDLTDFEKNTMLDYCGGNALICEQKIRTDIYEFTNAKGLSFLKVDDIATRNELVGRHSSNRVQAYIEHLFDKMANEVGSTYTYVDDVFDCAITDLELEEGEEDIIGDALNSLIDRNKMWVNKEQTILALTKYKELEDNIAKELVRINNGCSKLTFGDWESKLKAVEEGQGWKLNKEQREGALSIKDNQVTILTGFGGTGKTSSLKASLNMCDTEPNTALVCMSGKAAAVLSEATGLPASTIHRCLGISPEGGFCHDKNHQLEVDLVCIDECSMLNLSLFYSLIQAIPDNAKLVLIGDLGQLEPIGVGTCFKDIIDSKIFPHINLIQVHRQAKNSATKLLSYDVAEGKQFLEDDSEIVREDGDLKIITKEVKEDVAMSCLIEYKNLIKKGVSPSQITVVTGTRGKGATGCYSLNNEIQKILYKSTDKYIVVGAGSQEQYKLHLGERIMNLRNNYKIRKFGIDYDSMPEQIAKQHLTAIFNGQTGTVEDIDFGKGEATIVFDDGNKVVLREELTDCCLGAVSTCHKQQGSQNEYIIALVDYTSFKLLSKNWLYTAITRVKKGKCILIGQPKAIRYAISTDGLKKIDTFLKGSLQYFSNKLDK